MRKIAWMRGATKAFTRLPAGVREQMLEALAVAQRGGLSDTARPMKGDLRDIVEIRIGTASGAYRTMYTTQFGAFLYVVHVFQKKSTHGSETPKREIDVIRRRLKAIRAVGAQRN